MLLVPPGTFMMGCSPALQSTCCSDEYLVHEVALTQAFYLGRYEATQAQWDAVMGGSPSFLQGQADRNILSRPVERVSWNMIKVFDSATLLRLPTETEWEYACRVCTLTAYNLPPFGTVDVNQLGLVAWCFENSGFEAHVVGQKVANNLGFDDMHRNVWERVQDWNASGYCVQSPAVDRPGPAGGNYRVLCSYGWINTAHECPASSRESAFPPNGTAAGYLGSRVARTP